MLIALAAASAGTLTGLEIDEGVLCIRQGSWSGAVVGWVNVYDEALPAGQKKRHETWYLNTGSGGWSAAAADWRFQYMRTPLLPSERPADSNLGGSTTGWVVLDLTAEALPAGITSVAVPPPALESAQPSGLGTITSNANEDKHVAAVLHALTRPGSTTPDAWLNAWDEAGTTRWEQYQLSSNSWVAPGDGNRCQLVAVTRYKTSLVPNSNVDNKVKDVADANHAWTRVWNKVTEIAMPTTQVTIGSAPTACQ
jgi:hypothetical protein